MATAYIECVVLGVMNTFGDYLYKSYLNESPWHVGQPRYLLLLICRLNCNPLHISVVCYRLCCVSPVNRLSWMTALSDVSR